MDVTALVLGIGAVISGVAGILTAYASVRKARAEVHSQCQEELRAVRAENEADARALHKWRMSHIGEPEPE